MDKRVFNFPTLEDGVKAVESKYCELVNKYHKGEELLPEELDFMDYSNNVLQNI